MDNHIEQERAEARKALEVNGLGLPWRVGTASPNGLQNVGTKMGVMVCQTFNKEDAHLIANAPTWLRNSLDREEQLIGENERLMERLDEGVEQIEKGLEALELFNRKVAEQDKEIQKYKESITIALEALGHIENGVFGKPSSELAIEALDRINLI